MSQAPWSLRPYTLLDCFLWDLTQDDLSAVSPRLSDDTENTNPLRYSEVSKALCPEPGGLQPLLGGSPSHEGPHRTVTCLLPSTSIIKGGQEK